MLTLTGIIQNFSGTCVSLTLKRYQIIDYFLNISPCKYKIKCTSVLTFSDFYNGIYDKKTGVYDKSYIHTNGQISK